ncbi:MFS transporter [Microbacterium sp. LRZ72]|uniref:MFS transporter n=1 Tax=Microbacterium sp. LRZ72 TaxID=2942481 RepID=UPI0029A37801|nr:MFS transporter [Microbacterium sp. LRZ72]MDX2376160.1 MFS transporter [Microbacterium sp. LRZ72]
MNDVGLRSERGPILLALMLAIFLIAIDTTILSTAVPTIVAELGGFDQYPWLFSVYLLAQVATVPVYAKLADRIGRRSVMFVGIGLFVLGSVLSALAWSMGSLIAFRAVQGLGAGAIIPTALTVAGDIYTVRERARAQAYIASVWALSSVIGPTLGGLFSQFLSWRGIFWVNVPLGAIALVLFWRHYRVPFERQPQRIDIGGAILLTSGLVLLVLGVLEGGQAWPWVSWPSALLFGGSLLLLLAFALVERRAHDPIIEPWLVRSRVVVATAFVSLGVGAVLLGLTSFVPTFIESATGVVPVVAGLTVAALTLGWPLSAALAGRFYLRIGFRATAMVGSSVATVGALFLTTTAVLVPSVGWTAAGCFIVGLGMGLVANPALIAAQSSVTQEKRGVVSGTNVLARSIGSSVGVAIYGAVATSVIAAGGGADSPAAVQAGAVAVFVGVAVTTAVLLIASAVIPHVPIDD